VDLLCRSHHDRWFSFAFTSTNVPYQFKVAAENPAFEWLPKTAPGGISAQEKHGRRRYDTSRLCCYFLFAIILAITLAVIHPERAHETGWR
jgi:hypothetical protein